MARWPQVFPACQQAWYICQKIRKTTFNNQLSPAIRYAKQGFKIDVRHQKLLAMRQTVLNQHPETANIF